MVTLGATTQVFQSASSAIEAQDVRAQTVEKLNRAMRTMLQDLKFSGNVNVGSRNFPVLFDNGNADAAFSIHSHAPPNNSAGGTVAERAAIFLLIEDGNNDGTPDIGSDGNPIWSSDELSYVLLPQQDGRNRIERRINGVFDDLILSNVDTMLIDDRTTSGFAVPFGSLRITLTASTLDSDGRRFTETVAGLVSLRNSTGF